MIVATTNEKNIFCHLSHVNSASQPNHGGIRRFQRDVFIILYYLNLLFKINGNSITNIRNFRKEPFS